MSQFTAKLFRHGGGQAVRLPQECRFPDGQTEVRVHREGKRLVLEPADEWSDYFRGCLGAWPDEIPLPPRDADEIHDPFA